MSKVIAILCADLHLSHKAPGCRADNWYEVIKFYLSELEAMSKKYDCPVIMAGDIFDHWQQPPELINFVMENFPSRVYAIPGQHDLPNHSYAQIKRSAYWTLVEAGRIVTLPYGLPQVVDETLALFGFPWNTELKALQNPNNKFVNLAIVHKYIWMGKHKHPKAEDKDRIKTIAKALKGYDAVVAGDNHRGFLYKEGDCDILNCGAFIRRTVPEISYNPAVGFLMSTGDIVRVKLDTENDVFVTKEKQKKLEIIEGVEELIEDLEEDHDSIDFAESLRHYINSGSVNNIVRKRVIEALEASSVID